MNLALPWAPFISTIAGYWSSVMDKGLGGRQRRLDGSCEPGRITMHCPENNPIYDIANGTGPFMLDHWTPRVKKLSWSARQLLREPAKLERVVFQNVDEWSTRFAMMQAGDADYVEVPVENRSQMDALVGRDLQLGC